MGLRIVVLGGPGAGKGTQAVRVSERHGVPHISTGEMFRACVKGEVEVSAELRRYLDAGQLVPDTVTCGIVSVRIAERDCANGFVLDGFPRSLPQAEALHEMLEQRGEVLDVAVNIDVPDEEIVGRLVARRFCPVCGEIYNLEYKPSTKGGLCDRNGCSGELAQRDDDREETIRERLRVYHTTTKPIIGYYAEMGLLRTVPSAGLTPDDVFLKIEEVLDGLGVA